MFFKDKRKAENKVEGTKGEIIATQFLSLKKYKVLEANYSTKLGEIDIIAEDNGILVFVEVKARGTLAFGRPAEAVNWRKQNKIKKIAEIYLMKNNKFFCDVRFDVIEIVGDDLNHIENAF